MTTSEQTSQIRPETAPLLTVHTTLVLLTATVIGLVIGGLLFSVATLQPAPPSLA